MTTACGVTHSLGLNNGKIIFSGKNNVLQCHVPEGSNFIAVAAGSFHSLALTKEGEIKAWGYDSHKQCSDAPTGNNFIAIAAGAFHSLALTKDGEIIVWGYYNHESKQKLCNPPKGKNFVAISSKAFRCKALTKDGETIVWGYDKNCDVPIDLKLRLKKVKQMEIN